MRCSIRISNHEPQNQNQHQNQSPPKKTIRCHAGLWLCSSPRNGALARPLFRKEADAERTGLLRILLITSGGRSVSLVAPVLMSDSRVGFAVCCQSWPPPSTLFPFVPVSQRRFGPWIRIYTIIFYAEYIALSLGPLRNLSVYLGRHRQSATVEEQTGRKNTGRTAEQKIFEAEVINNIYIYIYIFFPKKLSQYCLSQSSLCQASNKSGGWGGCGLSKRA